MTFKIFSKKFRIRIFSPIWWAGVLAISTGIMFLLINLLWAVS